MVNALRIQSGLRRLEAGMDLIYLLLVLAFFAACYGMAVFLERLKE